MDGEDLLVLRESDVLAKSRAVRIRKEVKRTDGSQGNQVQHRP